MTLEFSPGLDGAKLIVHAIHSSLKSVNDGWHGPDHESTVARSVLAGVDSIVSSSVTATRKTVSEDAKNAREELDGVVANALKEASDIALSSKSLQTQIADTVSAAKRDCNDHLNESTTKAKKVIADAVRAIQDEKSRAVDSIALHMANATRQTPSLPDLIQAVSALHATTTPPPRLTTSPCCDGKSAIIRDLTNRLSALEESADQKQAGIDKLVDAKVTAALAKPTQRHREVLDSLMQTKIDKAFAKRDSISPAVSDSIVQAKVDKTLAKLDKRFEKELGTVRADLAASVAREKALSGIRAKEEERHQQVLVAMKEKTCTISKLKEIVDCMVNKYLESEKEAEDSPAADAEFRDFVNKIFQDPIATQIHEALSKQDKKHTHDLMAVRHDILDLAHSFIEVRSVIKSSLQDRSAPTSVSRFEEKLESLTNGITHKQTTLGHTLPTASPPSALSTGTTSITVTRTAPVAATITAPAAGLGSKVEGDDCAVTDVSDEDDSSFPEVSDDGYCVMEPNRAERADLAIKVSRTDARNSKSDETPSPTSTSTTFDNNGPLSVGSCDIAALVRAALTLPSSQGTKLIVDATSERKESTREFVALYISYLRTNRDELDLDDLWSAFKAIINSEHQSTSTSLGLRSESGSGPVIWEGAGLPISETHVTSGDEKRDEGEIRSQPIFSKERKKVTKRKK